MGSCINTASLLPQESQHKSYLEEKYDFAILSAREEFGVLFQSKRTEKTFRWYYTKFKRKRKLLTVLMLAAFSMKFYSLDRAVKRLRMLQISISKSFDWPFLAPCKVDFSVDFGVVSLEKMELGTRVKGVFCGGDFFRHAGNLSIYCLAVLQCKSRGNPANSWDLRLQRYGEWVNSEWVLRLNLALHFNLYLTKLLCKTHRVRIILDNNFRFV